MIYHNDTEGYFRINAQYVILSTGGFGTNEGMMRDLLPDLYAQLQEQDTMAAMGADRDGSCTAMAVQAGAKVEHRGPSPPWTSG